MTFTYLRVDVMGNHDLYKETTNQVRSKNKTIWRNKNLEIKTKIRIYKSYILLKQGLIQIKYQAIRISEIKILKSRHFQMKNVDIREQCNIQISKMSESSPARAAEDEKPSGLKPSKRWQNS